MVARIAAILGACVFSARAVQTGATVPSLKDAYRSEFLIGSALGGKLPGSYTPVELELIARQFNAATPEVCMKPRPIHPSENTWHFDEADAFVRFCQTNSIVPFGHTLVWHEDCPDWFFQDGEHAASRDLVLRRLKDHIQTILKHFKGKIRAWDVVNEAISDDPRQFWRKTKWHDAIGDDLVEQAFRFAHEADPDLQLQYNDYNIESEPKRSRAIKLLKDLQAKGIPVATVGIQGHWSLDHVPYADLEKAIDAFHSMGLQVAISELDLDVLSRKRPSGADDGGSAMRAAVAAPRPCPPEILRRQAEQYARLFELFHRHRGAITRVSFWGIDDAHTWLNGWPFPRYDHPLLFDRQAEPKPAFWSVIGIVGTARR